MRDYKKYLATEPTPSDYGEVHAEMNEFIEQRKREMKQPPPPPSSSSGGRQQYGARPGSGGTSGSSSSGAGAGWGGGKGPHPYASQSTHHQYWREQNEDFYEKFEQFKVSERDDSSVVCHRH